MHNHIYVCTVLGRARENITRCSQPQQLTREFEHVF
ncbi:hypothetical protein clg_42 [Corynebacterium phage CL31]|nr:hypothetical protein clg_42 [Corynebacterium phage CL31]